MYETPEVWVWSRIWDRVRLRSQPPASGVSCWFCPGPAPVAGGAGTASYTQRNRHI